MKNYTEIVKAVSPLIVVLVLGVFVVKSTLAKIDDQSVLIKKFQKENNTLSQKVKILSAVSVDTSTQVNAVTIALPDSNSSLAVVSQLKDIALTSGLKLGNLKAGSEVKDTSGLSRADISFEVEGPKPQIVDYLNTLPTIAPITIVDKVELIEVDQISRATVTVKAFWTAFPKTLPALNDTLSDLTEKETEILTEVSELKQPQFSSGVGEAVDNGRVDPFTQ